MIFFSHPDSFVKHCVLIDIYCIIQRGYTLSSVFDLLTFQPEARCHRFFVRHAKSRRHWGKAGLLHATCCTVSASRERI